MVLALSKVRNRTHTPTLKQAQDNEQESLRYRQKAEEAWKRRASQEWRQNSACGLGATQEVGNGVSVLCQNFNAKFCLTTTSSGRD